MRRSPVNRVALSPAKRRPLKRPPITDESAPECMALDVAPSVTAGSRAMRLSAVETTQGGGFRWREGDEVMKIPIPRRCSSASNDSAMTDRPAAVQAGAVNTAGGCWNPGATT